MGRFMGMYWFHGGYLLAWPVPRTMTKTQERFLMPLGKSNWLLCKTLRKYFKGFLICSIPFHSVPFSMPSIPWSNPLPLIQSCPIVSLRWSTKSEWSGTIRRHVWCGRPCSRVRPTCEQSLSQKMMATPTEDDDWKLTVGIETAVFSRFYACTVYPSFGKPMSLLFKWTSNLFQSTPNGPLHPTSSPLLPQHPGHALGVSSLNKTWGLIMCEP